MLTDRLRHIRLQREILDKAISEIQALTIQTPKKGWIKTVRESLGMSVSQLAKRSKLDKSTVSRLEANERNNTITLKSLQKLADALECELIFAVVPKNKLTLSKLLMERARLVLSKQAKNVEKTMSLEGQGDASVDDAIDRAELISTLSKSLWE